MFTKKPVLFLTLLFLTTILLNACSNSEKNKQDKAKEIAMSRDSRVVAEETQRTGLEICDLSLFEKCAKGGTSCRDRAVATEPLDCENPPSLKCICPEFTVCAWLATDAGHDWKCLVN